MYEYNKRINYVYNVHACDIPRATPYITTISTCLFMLYGKLCIPDANRDELVYELYI